MRPKLVAGVLLVALVLLAAAAWISRVLGPHPAPAPSVAAKPSAADSVTGEGKAAATAALKPEAAAPMVTATGADVPSTNPPPVTGPAHDDYVHRRIAELDALAMKGDSFGRDTILAELQNPDKAIRKGALDAAIQLSDRSVVPRLQEVAAQTEDPAEKADILAAIDYINLPSLTEYMAEQRAQRSALGLTNATRNPTNRPPGGHRSMKPQPKASQPPPSAN
jgi:hypothetical protein